jgi:hypothetical protein
LHYPATVTNRLGRSLGFVASAILLATPSLAAQHPIRLKNRVFTPPSGVTRPARAIGRRVQPPGHGSHFIVQFDGRVTPALRASLRAAGVRILRAVPENAVAIAAPDDIDLSSVPGVRWVGRLDAGDKISRHTFADIQRAGAGHPYSVVEFFPDVTRDAAVAAIAGAGGVELPVPRLPDQFAVIATDPAAIQALAADDTVAWIFPASDRLVSGAPAAMCDAIEDGTAVADFATEGDGWDGPGANPVRLGYLLSKTTADLSPSIQASELGRAMTEWSRYIDLEWTQAGSATATATVNILWGPTDHGDGFPFGASVLAHTFYPAPPGTEPLAGDLHFNDEFTWGVASAASYDIYSVALHELGHALGLTHSSDPASVMYPSYQGIFDRLPQVDIDTARRLYAARTMSALPSGWDGADIGPVGAAGQVTMSTPGTITVDASGSDVWGTVDEFTFASRTMTGDGDLVARVDSLDAVERWTKAGVMIRDGLDASAAHAFMLVSGSKGLAFQRRRAAGGVSYSTDGIPGLAPYWLKLSRRGDRFDAFAAPDGGAWTLIGSDTIHMGATVQAGVALTAHLDGALARATFSGVAVMPAPKWTSKDIGAVPIAGSFNNGAAAMTVTASGADIWGTADAFRFVWLPLDGDGEVVAHVQSVSYAHAWSKAGVMIRGSLDAGAAHAFVLVSAGKGFAFQRRRAAGQESLHTAGGSGTPPAWVRLVRRGDTFTAYVSSDGASWRSIGSDTIPMGGTVYAGLAVTSHSSTAATRAVFDSAVVR